MSKTGHRVNMNLLGPEGNALSIVGSVTHLLRRVDRQGGFEFAKDYKARALKGDYENVLKVTCEFIDLVDTSGEYTELLADFY